MIENANSKHVAVFNVTTSPRNKYVMALNMIMPDTKETNRPGQNSP